jgi:hypothetical protein
MGQLYLAGKVATIRPEPLYLFINDATSLPPYALGCGGIYWPVPSDGGEPLVQSTYFANFTYIGESPGDVITEASFLSRVAACAFIP